MQLVTIKPVETRQPDLNAHLQALVHFDVAPTLNANTLVIDGQALKNWQELTRAFWTLLQQEEE